MTTDSYITDDATGEHWRLMLGDSCERLAEIPDDSVHLSVCSPPFDSLYTYSPSVRDLGNSASRAEFLEHYRYVATEQLRVTMPGRNACVHVQQIATKKSVTGYVGLTGADAVRRHRVRGVRGSQAWPAGHRVRIEARILADRRREHAQTGRGNG